MTYSERTLANPCMETMDVINGDRTITVAFLTPQEGLGMLIDQVQALGLSRGNENSLTKKLKNAINVLNKNKDAGAAEKMIEAFKKEVLALAGKKIMPASDADTLLAKADLMLAAI